MMGLLQFVACSLFCVVCVLSKEDDVLYKLEIDHSFDEGEHFTKRGVVELDGLKQSSVVTINQLDISEEEQDNLLTLAASGGYYMIRARSVLHHVEQKDDTGEAAAVLTTFIKACLIVESDLRDIITLHGDGQGNVIGISIEAPVKECRRSQYTTVSLMSEFFTEVLLDNGVTGPAPEVQKYLHKMEEERKRATLNKDQDNRSFIQKYWLHLVIGFVVFTFMNAMQTGGAAAGGSPGGGGGGGQ
ncbi:ER membrane protein complex subunit 10-like [Dysidea avara]|uniref:ER membrane protein complex subunit 10-like n=1 Tax=Dysidea avara TaxID=196820 RepID=UPI003326F18B